MCIHGCPFGNTLTVNAARARCAIISPKLLAKRVRLAARVPAPKQRDTSRTATNDGYQRPPPQTRSESRAANKTSLLRLNFVIFQVTSYGSVRLRADGALRAAPSAWVFSSQVSHVGAGHRTDSRALRQVHTRRGQRAVTSYVAQPNETLSSRKPEPLPEPFRGNVLTTGKIGVPNGI